MSQSRRRSAIESVANLLVGAGIALLTQMAVFPLFGLEASFSTNLGITGCFTVVSMVRSYVLRRIFNLLER